MSLTKSRRASRKEQDEANSARLFEVVRLYLRELDKANRDVTRRLKCIQRMRDLTQWKSPDDSGSK